MRDKLDLLIQDALGGKIRRVDAILSNEDHIVVVAFPIQLIAQAIAAVSAIADEREGGG